MHSQTTCYYNLSTSDSKYPHIPVVDELIKRHGSITNYTSNTPRGSHRRNIFRQCIESIRLEYYRYEVTYGLYVLTFNEKLVVNTFVSVVLCLLTWALFHVPSWLYATHSYISWLMTHAC